LQSFCDIFLSQIKNNKIILLQKKEKVYNDGHRARYNKKEQKIEEGKTREPF